MKNLMLAFDKVVEKVKSLGLEEALKLILEKEGYGKNIISIDTDAVSKELSVVMEFDSGRVEHFFTRRRVIEEFFRMETGVEFYEILPNFYGISFTKANPLY